MCEVRFIKFRSLKLKLQIEVTDNNFQRLIEYFTKAGLCAIWLKFLIVHRKVSFVHGRVSLSLGKWWKVCVLEWSSYGWKTAVKGIWRSIDFSESDLHIDLQWWRDFSWVNWRFNTSRTWKVWQLLGSIWVILRVRVNDYWNGCSKVYHWSNWARSLTSWRREEGKVKRMSFDLKPFNW